MRARLPSTAIAGKMVSTILTAEHDMVVTIPASRSNVGPRPVNLNTDIPRLISLLQLVFGHEMHGEAQALFSGASQANAPSVLLRFNPALARLAPGYVWEEDQEIVGNVTLLATKNSKRFLVANVAVHPAYRRQGIARRLLKATIADVRRRHGQEILLQVAKENGAAIDLYRSMDFLPLGTLATWEASVSRLREPEVDDNIYRRFDLRPLSRRQWEEAFRLEGLSSNPNMYWPEPIDESLYRPTLRGWFEDFLNGRRKESWTAAGPDGHLAAVGILLSEWGRPYQLHIRIHPDAEIGLERHIVAKLVRRLRYQSRRRVQMVYADDSDRMNSTLLEANFRRLRTLTHMRLALVH